MASAGPERGPAYAVAVVSFDEILTLLVILGVLGVLVAERLSPAFTILAGLVVLLSWRGWSTPARPSRGSRTRRP